MNTPAAATRFQRHRQILSTLVALAIAGLLALASQVGTLPLVAVVIALQVVLVVGVLALVEAPGTEGALVVAVTAGAASDLLAVRHGGQLGGLAGVAGLALVAALLHQLIRRDRVRVTESLADTLVVVVLVQALACLPALRATESGREALQIVLAAAAAGLLAGRLGDRAAPRLLLVAGSVRTSLGLLLSLAAGAGAAVAVAVAQPEIVSSGGAALIVVAVVAAMAVGDLAVQVGAADGLGYAGQPGRAIALQRVALALPYALGAPVALLVSRLVLP